MMLVGDQLLEKTEDGRFQLSKPSIIWNFTKDQLLAEIASLQLQLAAKQDLLKKVESLDVVLTEVLDTGTYKYR